MPGLPVLVLSQYVEQLYARGLLAQGTGGVGYLLKDRVSDVTQFVDAIRRVAAGAAIAARIFTTDNAVGNTPTGELAARVIGVSGPAAGPQEDHVDSRFWSQPLVEDETHPIQLSDSANALG